MGLPIGRFLKSVVLTAAPVAAGIVGGPAGLILTAVGLGGGAGAKALGKAGERVGDQGPAAAVVKTVLAAAVRRPTHKVTAPAAAIAAPYFVADKLPAEWIARLCDVVGRISDAPWVLELCNDPQALGLVVGVLSLLYHTLVSGAGKAATAR